MDIIQKPLSEITPYAKNAKKHDQTQIDNVAESIKQYGFVQPIVIDRNGVIVIGHCRALAAEKLGMESVPCVCVDELTEEQVKALRLVDNKSNESEWDLNLLLDELPKVDLSDFDFDWDLPEEKEPKKETHGKLSDKFIVPPFSVINSNSGEWMQRKRQWNSAGLSSGDGRDVDTFADWASYKNYDGLSNVSKQSIFDPVLCELMYKWFAPEGGEHNRPICGRKRAWAGRRIYRPQIYRCRFAERTD